MRNKLFYYYPLTEEELKELWNTAIFVFDTNVLLDLYRYSESSREDLLKVITKLSNDKRLFIPYQVALEYQRGRYTVIKHQEEIYKTKKDDITKEFNTLKNKFNEFKNFEEKTKTDVTAKIDEVQNILLKSIEDYEIKHPKLMNDDFIMNEITELFSDSTGDEFTEEELKKIYAEGKNRYEQKIPPGYKDKSKSNTKENEDSKYINNEYGDLIIWKEMLKYGKNNNKSIIFITADVKEDWWLIQSGRTIFARPELRKEFKKETDNKFYMYQTANFLNYAKDKFEIHIDDSSVEELENIEEEWWDQPIYYDDEDQYHEEPVQLNEFIISLMMQQVGKKINKHLDNLSKSKNEYYFSFSIQASKNKDYNLLIHLNDAVILVIAAVKMASPIAKIVFNSKYYFTFDLRWIYDDIAINKITEYLIPEIEKYIKAKV